MSRTTISSKNTNSLIPESKTKNETEFLPSELKALFGASNCRNLSYQWIVGVSTDTRTLEKNNIFIAIVGENHNGHDSIGSAIKKYASVIFIERRYEEAILNEFPEFPFVIVDDTIDALGKLANYHRRKFSIPIIAIGGSNGKTTTKELTSYLLAQKYSVLKTYRNYNNLIGVPLTLLNISPQHSCVVIEIGTNTYGEIEKLSTIVEPTHGLITNIDKEHLLEFVDLNGVEKEETTLFHFLRSTEGHLFVNTDDQRLKKYNTQNEYSTSIGFTNGANVKGKVAFDTQFRPTLTVTYNAVSFSAKLRLIGLSSAINALAAAAIALKLGLTNQMIVKGLESYEPEVTETGYGRMVLEEFAGFHVINDCYNANPASMIMALRTLKELPNSGKKIAVLGDMLELGQVSLNEHKEILQYALDCCDQILLIGKEFAQAYEELPESIHNVHHYATNTMLVRALIPMMSKGNYTLVKGSRGLKLEEVLKGLKKHFTISLY